jgi:hypothetical protein
VATRQTERPQYFENQYLGAADLTVAVEYARLQQARHALGGHTWGIAMGLNLLEKATSSGDQVDVFVQPGFAWDGFGRPVVVLSPYKLSPEKFKSYTYDAAIDAGSPEGRLVEVWLRYSETETRGAPAGFEVCYPSDQFTRVDEFFQVEVGERTSSADQRDPVSVAGHTADAREALQALDPTAPLLFDETVPYQSFPDPEGGARWLIPVGLVRWKPAQIAGQVGNFVARNADDKTQSRTRRRYVGVVGESFGAADGRIRLRDRTRDYSAVLSNDLVWVEGDLRVEGNARLFGGLLDLRDAVGQDNGAPLHIARDENNGGGGTSLRARIGSAKDGKNRFDVGPLLNDKFEPRLCVLDSGRVGIGTTAPDRHLTIQGADGTYLNVKAQSGTYEVLVGADSAGGIVSTMTNHDLQLRAGGNSTKVIIKADGSVGIGTTDTSAARVVVDGVTSYNRGLGLVGDTPSGVGLFFDNKQGHKISLFASGANDNVGANGFGIFDDTINEYRLAIDGGGNVGIGTVKPNARLDVSGRIIRNGQDFSSAGLIVHGGVVIAPWGTVADWNIFVSPRRMGEEEPGSEGDNSMLVMECYAVPIAGTAWEVTAWYKYKYSNSNPLDGVWHPGTANYLLVPR